MVQQVSAAQLDAAFAALADATRRGVLEQLGRADASISELAERFDMTLTGKAFVDGESDEFVLRSLEGIDALPKLRELILPRAELDPESPEFRALRARGVKVVLS